MPESKLTMITDDLQRSLVFDEGQTVLEVLQQAGIAITATCGGRGTCGKCRVLVDDEQGLEYRLACTTVASDGMQVFTRDPAEMVIQDLGQPALLQADADVNGYGVAIDVGTTTVVCRLYDLNSGASLATASRVNPQVVYGADVMSRIDASISGKLGDMQGLLLSTLRELIASLCKTAAISCDGITRIALAANTVMEHIAAGLPPDSIGVAPFTPLSLFGDDHSFADFPAPLWFAPAIYGYVGGDISAGLLAVGMDRSPHLQLLVDLGTNGEIALGDSSGILCAATAAGPVFEGAGIHFGMPALPGAIASVRAKEDGLGESGGLQLGTIADAKPIGICGSGLIDVAALLLQEGIIDQGGRMLDISELPPHLRRFCGAENEIKVFYLTEDRSLYVTQKDLRNLQLAKGAICAGIETLMQKGGLKPSDIHSLHIAGGFGKALDLDNAAIIGLFPIELRDRAASAGNTAIEGISAAVVSAAARVRLRQLAESCSYVELSADVLFNELFIDALGFKSIATTEDTDV